MVHQPHVSGVGGQSTDIEIHAKEILKTREEINEILADHTGRPLEVIQQDTDRDFWLSAAEAVDYGAIDAVLKGRQLEAVSG